MGNSISYQMQLLPNEGHVEGFATMTLDRMGVINQCDPATAAMFCGSFHQLIGKSISSFIPGIPFSCHDPGFNARSIAYLSNCADWQEFRGVDLKGQGFPVKLKLTRINEHDKPNEQSNSNAYFIEFLNDKGGTREDAYRPRQIITAPKTQFRG